MYEAIRNEIQTGDMFFTWDNSLLSRLIRLFTKSKVSHVGLFLVISGRVFCVECREGKGCIMTPASIRLKGDFLIKEGKAISEEAILQDVGRVEYDYIGALLALFINTGSARKYCSEWVAEKLGVSKDKGVTPEYLFNI